jgi:hypothetical protein
MAPAAKAAMTALVEISIMSSAVPNHPELLPMFARRAYPCLQGVQVGRPAKDLVTDYEAGRAIDAKGLGKREIFLDGCLDLGVFHVPLEALDIQAASIALPSSMAPRS